MLKIASARMLVTAALVAGAVLCLGLLAWQQVDLGGHLSRKLAFALVPTALAGATFVGVLTTLGRVDTLFLSLVSLFVVYVLMSLLFVVAFVFTNIIPYTFFKQTFQDYWLKQVRAYGVAIVYFSVTTPAVG